VKPGDDLSCAELVELVTDYLEGVLPAVERERFEAHVVLCDGCASHLDQMQVTISVVGRLAEEDVPETAAAELLEAFRGWNAA
jgi:anti-sigma factor RsiW